MGVPRRRCRRRWRRTTPRARPMTPEMVDEMDLQKSLAFYKDRFADASDFTFVFAGSFDLDGHQAAGRAVPRVAAVAAAARRRGRTSASRRRRASSRRWCGRASSRRARRPSSSPARCRSTPPHEVALDALALVLENRLRRTLREALRGTYGVEVEAERLEDPRTALQRDDRLRLRSRSAPRSWSRRCSSEIEALQGEGADRAGGGRRARRAAAPARERPGAEQPAGRGLIGPLQQSDRTSRSSSRCRPSISASPLPRFRMRRAATWTRATT